MRAEISELVEMLRSYAVQETVGPLRGLGRYLLFGLVGALGVSLGVVLAALALVRVLQAETDLFNANWSFVPHAAGAAFLVLAILMLIRAVRPRHNGADASDGTARRASENAAGNDDD